MAYTKRLNLLRWLIYLIDLVVDNSIQRFTFPPTQHTVSCETKSPIVQYAMKPYKKTTKQILTILSKTFGTLSHFSTNSAFQRILHFRSWTMLVVWSHGCISNILQTKDINTVQGKRDKNLSNVIYISVNCWFLAASTLNGDNKGKCPKLFWQGL